MGQKGTSRKSSSNQGTGKGRAAPVTIASRSGKRSSRQDQADSSPRPVDDAVSRRYGTIVIAITLVALAVPIVFSVIALTRVVPMQTKVELFTPWWAYLISLGVIAMTWITYIVWSRQQQHSANS